MGTTTEYGWRTPNPADVNNVPTDMEELADDIEGTVSGLDGELGPVRTGFIYLTTVYFEASGSFVKANFPGIKAVRAKMVGGGGSCGGAGATVTDGGACPGGGGGGEYAEKFLLATELASVEPIVVGLGGAAALANANGSNGGASSLGTSKVVANGGEHGDAMAGDGTGARTSAGGEGGTGGTGDLLIDGSDGGTGRRVAGGSITQANYGGHSHMSASAAAGVSNSSGEAGRRYGGGSGGCNSGASEPARGSTAGADGLVIVDVFV